MYFGRKIKSPSALIAPAGFSNPGVWFLILECGSSPARSSRDDGDDDDGGERTFQSQP
jgi:hypothetical protein